AVLSAVSRQTHLPAAAQGAEGGDEAERDVATRERQFILLTRESGLEQDHRGEIDRPFAILVKADLYGSAGRAGAGFQVASLLLRLEVADDPILGFPTRLQHGVLVGVGQPLEAGVLDPDIVENATVVQDVPAEGGAEDPKQAAGPEQVVEMLGGKADRPNESKSWVEVGFRDADAGALGRDLALGPADIGPPTQEVRRYADNGLGRRHRSALSFLER